MTAGIEREVVQHFLGDEVIAFAVLLIDEGSDAVSLAVLRQLHQGLDDQFLHWVLQILAVDTRLKKGYEVVDRL